MSISMSELEFFLLTKVLIQNSNIVEFVKFLEKTQIRQSQIIVVTLKMTSFRTMTTKYKIEKKRKPKIL
jgi:hypothetical protein